MMEETSDLSVSWETGHNVDNNLTVSDYNDILKSTGANIRKM